jgi:hypothetical protein
LLGAVLLPASAALAAPVVANPDAELIALCARHQALIDAVNASPDDCDTCPAWQAYEVSRDTIGDAKPQTLAGMRAKALVAKAEALTPDGSEQPSGSMAEAWSWDLVNDLLRLTGGAA